MPLTSIAHSTARHLRYVTALIALCTPVAGALAATYTVSNCLDSGAGSLRQAVTAANDQAGADVINFNISCSRINLLTPILVSDSVDIVGPGAQSLTLANATDRVFRLEPASMAPAYQTVTIARLRLADSRGGNGGAVYASRSNLGLNAVVFASNEAAETGAALQFEGNSDMPRTLDIERCTFVANGHQSTAGGGAIYASRALLSVRGSLFRQNGSSRSTGGAIYAIDGTTVIDSSAFTANSASTGGAIAVAAIVGQSTLRVLASTLLNNVAANSDPSLYGGGAIWTSRSALQIHNSTLFGNTVQGSATGAAIDAYGSSLQLINNSIVANRVESSTTPNGAITGLYAFASDDVVPVSIHMRNTAVTGTTALDAMRRHDVLLPLVEGTSGTLDSAFNFVSSQRVGTTDSSTTQPPLLGSIAANGGPDTGAPGAAEPMYTVAPAFGSPLRNAGSVAAAVALATDQRGEGFPRVTGSAIDIGSIELAMPVVVDELPQPVPVGAPWSIVLLALLALALTAATIGRTRPRA